MTEFVQALNQLTWPAAIVCVACIAGVCHLYRTLMR